MSISAPSSASSSAVTSGTSPTSPASPTSTSSATSTTNRSASTPPFQIFGLATGLDTNAIIDKLTALYSMPMQQIQRQQAVTLQKQTAWNDIQTKLNSVQTAIQNLQAPAAAGARIGTTTPPTGATAAPFTISASPTAALGSFNVTVTSLATNAQLTGGTGIARPISAATTATTSPLASEGFGSTPTTGTVTINGAAITIDSSTTLLGGAGTNSVQAKINALPNLSFTPTIDGSGNVTGVTLASTTVPGTPIQLGTPGDTSNLLMALRLNTAIPNTAAGAYSVASNGALAGVNPSAALGSANINGVFSASGSFAINGKTINYANTDTLNSLIGTINAAGAGVTANYDSLSDRLILTASATGTGGIAVTDPTGSGLPAALKVSGVSAVMTAGLPAQLTISGINGGNPIASASNTVTGLIPGVTLNLTGTSAGLGATKVTIAQDTTVLTNALQSFVTAYNSVQDTITKYTVIQQNQAGPNQVGILAGDPTLQGLAAQLDRIVNGTTATVNGQRTTLAQLGISTGTPGAFGSNTVPTLDLQFNTTTATNALATTPGLGAAFIGNGSISSQTGTLFGTLGGLVNSWVAPLGGVNTALNGLSAEYTNEFTSLNNWQRLVQQQRQLLVKRFSAMETSVSLLQAQGQALAAQLGALTSGNGNSSGRSGG